MPRHQALSRPLRTFSQLSRLILIAVALLVILNLPALAQVNARTSPSVDLSSVLIRTRNLPGGWLPLLDLRLNGPIESGMTLEVAYELAGKPWLKLEIVPDPRPAYRRLRIEAIGAELEAARASKATGPVSVRIKAVNELSGFEEQLYQGRFEVRQAGTAWYVDQDWHQPFAILTSDWYPQDTSDEGHQLPPLVAKLWLKGDSTSLKSTEAQLYFEGKLVSRSAGQISQSAPGPQSTSAWNQLKFSFEGPPGVIFWNSFDLPEGKQAWILGDHPGSYELKILHLGLPSRGLRFKVSPEGRIVPHAQDPALNLALNLQDGWIFPLTVLSASDGTWNGEIWRSEAFYANPLKAFEP